MFLPFTIPECALATIRFFGFGFGCGDGGEIGFEIGNEG